MATELARLMQIDGLTAIRTNVTALADAAFVLPCRGRPG